MATKEVKTSPKREVKPKETKANKPTKTNKDISNKYKENIVVFILSISLFFVGFALSYNFNTNKETKDKAEVCFKGSLIGVGVVFILGFIVGVFRIGK